MKTVVFVGNEVHLEIDEDVLWAMTTRLQFLQDCHFRRSHAARNGPVPDT
ncbi:hypothetical protein [Roseibium sp. Sym1]